MAYTTIDDPSAYFKVQLYTGNGSADHAITFDDTDTDMQPDLVWIKNRDATDSHCLFDAVRGATEVLHPDTTAEEDTDADTLDSFASDGFQVDADVKVNTNTEKYVAWCWKMGTTSGATFGAAGITPTSYSINTTTGQGVYKYSAGDGFGASTVAHGLGAAPDLVIIKRIENSGHGWQTTNTALGFDVTLVLEATSAESDNVLWWNDTAPTSDVVSIGGDSWNNNDGNTFMMYCFTNKQGYFKTGIYTGNDNADGPFVYTGFRPAFVMTKGSDVDDNWWMFDNKREGYNGDNPALYPDRSNAESSGGDWIDLLSNGFKMRTSDPAGNGDGSTYIYIAFAEAPFVNSNGVPCNAR